MRYFKEEFGADLKSHFPNFGDLCEVVLRRHAIVHAGGIATSEYIRRVSKLNSLTIDMPKPDKRIPLKPKYIKNAWCLLYAGGVILLHLIAVMHARQSKSKKDENSADVFLVNASFNNINADQLFAAEMILSYAHKRRLANPSSDQMVRINLAQTYKWQGNESECTKVLKEYDWDSSSANFRTCVAALHENEDKFRKNLKIAAQEKSLSLGQLCEWPVFRAMQTKKEFPEWVKEAFGAELAYTDYRAKPRLLNSDPQQKTSEFFGQLMQEILQLPSDPTSKDS